MDNAGAMQRLSATAQGNEFAILAVHADLQQFMDAHICGSSLKKVNQWLQTSQIFTPKNVQSCEDFSDVFQVLSSIDMIKVGNYDKLIHLCDRIDEIKYLVPEIELHEEKISKLRASQQDDKQTEGAERLARSQSLTPGLNAASSILRCPTCGRTDIAQYERDGNIVHDNCLDDNNLGDCGDSPLAGESATLRLRQHRRSSSLPHYLMSDISHPQQQLDTWSDNSCTLKSLPFRSRTRCQTERTHSRSIRTVLFRSPSYGPIEALQRRVPYTYSYSSLLDLSSLADIMDQSHPGLDSDNDSVQSEPIYFGISPTSKFRSGQPVSSYLDLVFNESSYPQDIIGIAAEREFEISPSGAQTNLLQFNDVQIYINSKYDKLQFVSTSFKYLAIYNHIAVLAMCCKHNLKQMLKACVAKIYSLNNFWMIIINNCHNSAFNIEECFKDIVLNIFSGFNMLVEQDMKTVENHVSQINDSVARIGSVLTDIESFIAELEQVFVKEKCDCEENNSPKHQIKLLKLSSVVIRNMKPILSKFRKTLDSLIKEVDIKEDIRVICQGLNDASQTASPGRTAYLESMEKKKIRWVALKKFCIVDCPRHADTKMLIRNLLKEDHTPGKDTEKEAWDLADKILHMRNSKKNT